MDISSELKRLLPEVAKTPTYSGTRNYLAFLDGLNKLQYEKVLDLLPDLLMVPTVVILPVGAEQGDRWIRFVDLVCYHSLLNYTRHVPAAKIYGLLATHKTRVGRVAELMSGPMLQQLEQVLHEAEIKDYMTFLEAYFRGDRPGMIDFAIEETLRRFKNEKLDRSWEAFVGKRSMDDPDLPPEHAYGEHFLKIIQAKRRKDPKRLPATITTAADARFLVEEANRELFVYPNPDRTKATALLQRVYDWYKEGNVYRATRRFVTLNMTRTWFFDEIGETISDLHGNLAFEGWWEKVVLYLRDESFWRDIAGLNQDKGIPFESTQLYRDQQAYMRAGKLTLAVYAGILLLPVTIRVVAAAPGAVTRLFQWTGGRLLLAARYSSSMIGTYGAVGGAVQMGREGYTYYMQNALTINQHIVSATEFVLEITTEGMGMAPGTSPADLYTYTQQKLALLVSKKGIAELAGKAKMAAQQADTEVQLAEFVIRDASNKAYRVVGKVTGAEGDKIKVTRVGAPELAEGLSEQETKRIIFYGKEKRVGEPILHDPRSTKSNGVTPPTATDTNPKALNRTPDPVKADPAKLPIIADLQKPKSADIPVDQLATARAKRAEQLRQQTELAKKREQELAEAKKQVVQHKVAVGAERQGVISNTTGPGGNGRATGPEVGRVNPASDAGGGAGGGRGTGGSHLVDDANGVKDRAKDRHLTSVPPDAPFRPPEVPSKPGSGILDIDPQTGLPRQIAGPAKIGPAFKTAKEAEAAGEHALEVVVKDRRGNVVARWYEASEKGNEFYGHTEQKALNRIRLSPGLQIEFEGRLQPCAYHETSSCFKALDTVSAVYGVDIHYGWPGGSMRFDAWDGHIPSNWYR
jgi:hypothetical protein